MSVPERSGLLEITLILSCSAVSKKERLFEYFYAKASGIKMLMGSWTNLNP